MFSDIAYLGKITKITDEIGDTIKKIIYDKEIYCQEKSVKYSEFYQAQAVGLKPEITIEMMLTDYNKEQYVLYEDEEFKVLRTYKKSRERIELILVRGIN